MAIRELNRDPEYKEYVKTSDIEKCRFYWDYINLSIKNSEVNSIEPNKPSDYCDIINKKINLLAGGVATQKQLVRNMILECDTYLLPKEETDWIDKNNVRLCFWAWSYCRLANVKQWKVIGSNGEKIPSPRREYFSADDGNLYTELDLNTFPATASQRYNLIIKFLGYSPKTPIITAPIKSLMLQDLQKYWGITYQLESFKWLCHKDVNQCEWAWNYLINSKEYAIPTWFIPTPTNHTQMHDATIVAFDVWKTAVDTKKLFMLKMKKAWSQKKHRDSMVGKKAYSIVMSDSVKDKLDNLATIHGKKKNEVVEWLINQEFIKQIGGG